MHASEIFHNSLTYYSVSQIRTRRNLPHRALGGTVQVGEQKTGKFDVLAAATAAAVKLKKDPI